MSPCKFGPLAHARLRLIETTRAEGELAGDEPEHLSVSGHAPIYAHPCLDGDPALPIGSQLDFAPALFRPPFGKSLRAPVEAILRIVVPDRGQISGDFGFVFAFDRCVVDVARQEEGTNLPVCPGHHEVFLTALPAEPNRIEPGSGSFRIFNLTVEKDRARLRAKRGKYVAGPCYEAVELEGEKRSVAVAATLVLREADPRQETL